GANNTINAIALDTSFSPARIFIGGSFTSYNGNGSTRLARLNADGSFDSSFNVGTGADNTVSAIVYDSANSAVLIGGSFQNYNSAAVNRLARISATGANAGSRDGAFVVGSGSTGGPNNTVNTIAFDANGNVLIG